MISHELDQLDGQKQCRNAFITDDDDDDDDEELQ